MANGTAAFGTKRNQGSGNLVSSEPFVLGMFHHLEERPACFNGGCSIGPLAIDGREDAVATAHLGDDPELVVWTHVVLTLATNGQSRCGKDVLGEERNRHEWKESKMLLRCCLFVVKSMCSSSTHRVGQQLGGSGAKKYM